MGTLKERLERAVADKGLSIGDAWSLLSEALDRIERLEADARRYRWLRELRDDDSISVLAWSAIDGDDEEAADERTGAPLHYDELDAAIDAALSSPTAQEGE